MSNASIPQAFRLMDLPPEIVQKILIDYQISAKRLRTIRPVCRQINDLVKDEALRSLDLSHAFPWNLRRMAKRPNTFDEVTTTLTLPRSTERPMEWNLSLRGYICSIIKKMKRLRTVHWDLSHPPISSTSRRQPCIYATLSSIPSLEKIVIKPREDSDYWEGGIILLGSKLRNPHLKCISIGCKTSRLGAGAATLTENLRYLVAAHAGLEELESWDQPGSTGRGLDLAVIVGDTPYSSGFRPSLRVLHARNLHFSATESPAVLKYLARLTTLSISNMHPDHDTLWPALHLCGIMLKSLSIEAPTKRLTDYLSRYRGLKELTINRFGRDVHTGLSGDLKNRFLEQGVAHHRDSLVGIDIIFYPCHQEGHTHLALWALKEAQIAWLEGFPKLETLTVSFAHDGERVPKGTNIALGPALNALCTRLSPTLRQVELVCGTSECYGKPSDNQTDLAIVRSMRSFEFTGSPRNPEMRLKIYDATWKILYDQTRGTYRFVLEKTEAEEDE
ncbi:hypothetical protein NMY22_g5469 [Coprinellus aureogranulatus]|nr:hypothetical protein NMY22_g5469 [Coprinellus aureogranulatus]